MFFNKHIAYYIRDIISQRKKTFKISCKRKLYWYAFTNNLYKLRPKNLRILARYHYIRDKQSDAEYDIFLEEFTKYNKRSFDYWYRKGYTVPDKYIKETVVDWLTNFGGDMDTVRKYYITNYNKFNLDFRSRHLLEVELGISEIVPDGFYGYTIQQYAKIVGRRMFECVTKDVFTYIYGIDSEDIYDSLIHPGRYLDNEQSGLIPIM